MPDDAWRFGALRLTPDDPSIPDAVFPVAARRGLGLFSDGFESGDTSAWSAALP